MRLLYLCTRCAEGTTSAWIYFHQACGYGHTGQSKYHRSRLVVDRELKGTKHARNMNITHEKYATPGLVSPPSCRHPLCTVLSSGAALHSSMHSSILDRPGRNGHAMFWTVNGWFILCLMLCFLWPLRALSRCCTREPTMQVGLSCFLCTNISPTL